MNSFMKADRRMFISIFAISYELRITEHPAVAFAVTKDEIMKLCKENFVKLYKKISSSELLQEFTAKEVYDIFHMPENVFSVLALSHFSWKMFLLNYYRLVILLPKLKIIF